MKQKISITLDEETVFEIQNNLRTGKFRNKSHVVEYAVKKLLEAENFQEEILLEGDLK